MMLRPRWPSAGPIGGDGLALPAGTWSLIIPTIFLAIANPDVLAVCRNLPRKPSFRPQCSGESEPTNTGRCPWLPAFAGTTAEEAVRPDTWRPSHLLDLRVLQFDRRCPAEDRHRDLDPRLLLVDLLDDAVERRERPVAHPHLLADLVDDRGFRPLD